VRKCYASNRHVYIVAMRELPFGKWYELRMEQIDEENDPVIQLAELEEKMKLIGDKLHTQER
jgi:hypothetical protein